MVSRIQAVLTAKLQKFLELENYPDFAESIALPSVDFAAMGKTAKSAKKKNCTPGKSLSCGYSCQPKVSQSGDPVQCSSSLDPQPSSYANFLSRQAQRIAKQTGGDAKQIQQQLDKNIRSKVSEVKAKGGDQAAQKEAFAAATRETAKNVAVNRKASTDTKTAETQKTSTQQKPQKQEALTNTKFTPSPVKEDPTIPDRKTGVEKFKLLGEGIEGPVVLDPGPPKRAIKYGKTGSIREDVIENLNAAGELGIAPKMLGKSTKDKAIAMEFLDGYKVGIHPTDDSEDDDNWMLSTIDTTPYDKSFARQLKKAHDNGYVVYDLHEENVMVNKDTKDIKFIDQGGFAKGSFEELAGQALDRYSYRPFAAQTLERMVKTNGSPQAKKDFEALQDKWEKRKKNKLGEKDYEQMLKQMYSLLNLD